MSIYVLLYSGISAGWAFLWVHTFKTHTVKRLVLHTIVFVILSLFVALLVCRITFIPVDESYSRTNINALGLMAVIFLCIFAVACITAFYRCLVKIMKRDDSADK